MITSDWLFFLFVFHSLLPSHAAVWSDFPGFITILRIIFLYFSSVDPNSIFPFFQFSIVMIAKDSRPRHLVFLLFEEVNNNYVAALQKRILIKRRSEIISHSGLSGRSWLIRRRRRRRRRKTLTISCRSSKFGWPDRDQTSIFPILWQLQSIRVFVGEPTWRGSIGRQTYQRSAAIQRNNLLSFIFGD